MRTENEGILLAIDEIKRISQEFCPLHYLRGGTLIKHSLDSCLGRVCGICLGTGHFRNTCEHKLGQFPGCWLCYLPQSLCNHRLHDPETEFGKLACPWKGVTTALMKLATENDPRITSHITIENRSPQQILQKLWTVPERGDLLPLGVRLLAVLHAGHTEH